MRHVAIRAGSTHARAVGIVNRRLELGKHVVAHLVAAGAERLGVGQLEGGVERAPENNARQEAAEHQHAEAKDRTGAPEHVPQVDDKAARALPPRRTRLAVVAHRGAPGSVRGSRESMSTKSLPTGGLVTCCGT